MTPRRELTTAALLCTAAAALVILAAGRVWATAVGAGAPSVTMSMTGGEIGVPTGVLGWASLATLGALFAVRGRARVAVGAVLLLLGLVIAAYSLFWTSPQDALDAAVARSPLFVVKDLQSIEWTSWKLFSATGGVIIAAVGCFVMVRGSRWPGMSARYDGKAAAARPAAEDDPGALWKSLDRGEDPTAAKD